MNNEILYNGVLGLAVGEALGVPVEFCSREEIWANPVHSMRSGGVHGQKAGIWSDDTSMTLATADSLTHGHLLSIIGCEICTFLIWALMENPSMGAIAEGLKNAKRYYDSPDGNCPEVERYARLFQPDFSELPECAIQSTGFVVHTLEAAVWCLLNTEDFRTCALKAVNLGNDTDTVCAVACSLAALVYGLQSIPEQWIEVLANQELIQKICLNNR